MHAAVVYAALDSRLRGACAHSMGVAFMHSHCRCLRLPATKCWQRGADALDCIFLGCRTRGLSELLAPLNTDGVLTPAMHALALMFGSAVMPTHLPSQESPVGCRDCAEALKRAAKRLLCEHRVKEGGFRVRGLWW